MPAQNRRTKKVRGAKGSSGYDHRVLDGFARKAYSAAGAPVDASAGASVGAWVA